MNNFFTNVYTNSSPYNCSKARLYHISVINPKFSLARLGSLADDFGACAAGPAEQGTYPVS